jgi:hypothetical protein
MYTFDDVAEFISEQAGAEKTKINLESRLVENLGIDGDDFFELKQAFANLCRRQLSRLFTLSICKCLLVLACGSRL